MLSTSALPYLIRRRNHSAVPRRPFFSEPGSFRASRPEVVEIAVPDGYSCALLLERIAPWFPAEIVVGGEHGWGIRLEGGPAGGDWVLKVLGLVEEWLDAVPLKSAKVRHRGGIYVITAPTTGSSRSTPWRPLPISVLRKSPPGSSDEL